MNLLRGLGMTELFHKVNFMSLFHLVEYLKGFDDDTPVETVMAYLEADLNHYMSKENKTIRDHFEIIQTKFFIDKIENTHKIFEFRTSYEFVKSFSDYLELYAEYIEEKTYDI